MAANCVERRSTKGKCCWRCQLSQVITVPDNSTAFEKRRNSPLISQTNKNCDAASGNPPVNLPECPPPSQESDESDLDDGLTEEQLKETEGYKLTMKCLDAMLGKDRLLIGGQATCSLSEEESDESDFDDGLNEEQLKETEGYKLTMKYLDTMLGKPQT